MKRTRKPIVFLQIGFALIHKNHFLNRKHSNKHSPWLGPYEILKAPPTALVVQASPTLGGWIQVSTSLRKNWKDLTDDSTHSGDNAFQDGVEPDSQYDGFQWILFPNILNKEILCILRCHLLDFYSHRMNTKKIDRWYDSSYEIQIRMEISYEMGRTTDLWCYTGKN